LRERERASPTLLFKALTLPAISYTDVGTKFTILFDPKTHLPAAIRMISQYITKAGGGR
jgi:hypothetical protein